MGKSRYLNKEDAKLWQKMYDRLLHWIDNIDNNKSKEEPAFFADMYDWVRRFEQLQIEKQSIVDKYRNIL